MKRALLATTFALGTVAGPAFAWDDGIGRGEDSIGPVCGQLCIQQQRAPDDGNRFSETAPGPEAAAPAGSQPAAGTSLAARTDADDEDLGDEIGDAADDAGHEIESAADEAGDAIGDAADDVGDEVSDAADDVGDAISEGADDVGDAFD